jgi:hypothetical protein
LVICTLRSSPSILGCFTPDPGILLVFHPKSNTGQDRSGELLSRRSQRTSSQDGNFAPDPSSPPRLLARFAQCSLHVVLRIARFGGGYLWGSRSFRGFFCCPRNSDSKYRSQNSVRCSIISTVDAVSIITPVSHRIFSQVVLQPDRFLSELTSMYERSTEKGSVWVTMKRCECPHLLSALICRFGWLRNPGID